MPGEWVVIFDFVLPTGMAFSHAYELVLYALEKNKCVYTYTYRSRSVKEIHKFLPYLVNKPKKTMFIGFRQVTFLKISK